MQEEQINEKTFLERLKENKFFEDPDESIAYRLPVCQYYLTHKTNYQLLLQGIMYATPLINIKYNKETDYTLVHRAFEEIRKQFIKN